MLSAQEKSMYKSPGPGFAGVNDIGEASSTSNCGVVVNVITLFFGSVSAENEVGIIVPWESLGQQPPPAEIDPLKVPQPRPPVREW